MFCPLERVCTSCSSCAPEGPSALTLAGDQYLGSFPLDHPLGFPMLSGPTLKAQGYCCSKHPTLGLGLLRQPFFCLKIFVIEHIEHFVEVVLPQATPHHSGKTTVCVDCNCTANPHIWGPFHDPPPVGDLLGTRSVGDGYPDNKPKCWTGITSCCLRVQKLGSLSWESRASQRLPLLKLCIG